MILNSGSHSDDGEVWDENGEQRTIHCNDVLIRVISFDCCKHSLFDSKKFSVPTKPGENVDWMCDYGFFFLLLLVLPPVKDPRYAMDRRLSESQSRYGRHGENS
jgi:hypothetical protein